MKPVNQAIKMVSNSKFNLQTYLKYSKSNQN